MRHQSYGSRVRWRRERSRRPDLAELQRRYTQACDLGDFVQQLALLETITETHPEVSWGWYDLGLRLKWQGDWPRSRDANLRALPLLDDPVGAPEAWNLGIAATVLRDWPTARRAWAAFGIRLPDAVDSDPIVGDFGLTPIRLNPDARFSRTRVADRRHAVRATAAGGAKVTVATEVVWARRLCPARAQVVNVPLPESGHRFGDVILHDGDSVGKRRLGDSERPVFNEIEVFEPGPHATLTTVIDEPSPGDLQVVQDRFDERGYALEQWTHNIGPLCKACSENNDTALHDHSTDGEPLDGTVTLGVAAPADEALALLDEWLDHHELRRGPLLETEPPPR